MQSDFSDFVCVNARHVLNVRVLMLSAFVGIGSTAHAQVVADSDAQFSGVQGQAGWQYGFYESVFNPSGFHEMPRYGMYAPGVWSRSANAPGGYYTLHGANGLVSPNGDSPTNRVRVNNWAVRRWTSHVSGPVLIEASLRKEAPTAGNGVAGHLFLRGQRIWNPVIAFDDRVGATFRTLACLQVNDVIDFAVEAIDGDHEWDLCVMKLSVRSVFTSLPESQAVCPGSTATISVQTFDNSRFTFRWYRDFTLIDPQTNPTAATPMLRLDNFRVTNEGFYWCTVTDACGSASTPIVSMTAFATCCDRFDFNNNGVFPEDQDVVDYLSVLAGGACATCNDIDFNNNDVFPEDQDVIDFFNVLAGGDCP